MIFSIPLVMFWYMAGGQCEKWIRPTGVALSLYLVYLAFYHSTWYLGLPCLLYGFELTFGYGPTSWFEKLAKGNDELTRIYYSIWCCIPVIVACIVNFHWWALLGCLAIIGAFQIRLGGFTMFTFKGKAYQLLWEDAFRSLAIGLAMCLAL